MTQPQFFDDRVILPLPDGETLELRVTLGLVEDMERAGGSLFAAAEKLVARELTVTSCLDLLCAACKNATCALHGDALRLHLLQLGPAVILTRLLAMILEPMKILGLDGSENKT